MIEAVVMESHANNICLFGAGRVAKLITRAYANGEREPKGPETRGNKRCEDESELI